MNMPERPLLESYWVEPGRFLAGEYPARRSDRETRELLAGMLAAGLDTFFDLTNLGELDPYLSTLAEESSRLGLAAFHRRFPIDDFGLPSTQQMTTILDAIDAALAAGHRIYLHCWGGIGRTGTTVGCYLVRRGSSGAQALHQLEEWWHLVPKSSFHPRSPETTAQRQFILTWK
jgi:protein-tyrosine phosphatase